MELKHLITPKNEDGSVDHRYIPIAQSIVDLAGERVEAQLWKLYAATSNLEKESASAGLQLVIALFSIPMDERFERSKFKKHIREQLQEIGFKPSKVSKLLGAGEFYARSYGKSYDEFECYSESEIIKMQNCFLDEYFKNISKLYELSRMSDEAIYRVRREFLRDKKVYTQAELEKLRRANPKEVDRRGDMKRDNQKFSKQSTVDQIAAHDPSKDVDRGDGEYPITQIRSGQFLIEEFFHLFRTGQLERLLDDYTAAAQAHLIDEIRIGIPLLEEFVSKNKIVEVDSTY